MSGVFDDALVLERASSGNLICCAFWQSNACLSPVTVGEGPCERPWFVVRLERGL